MHDAVKRQATTYKNKGSCKGRQR